MDTLTYFLISVLFILSIIVMALVALYHFLQWRKVSSHSVQPLDLAVTAATVTVRLEEERISGVEQAPTRYLHRYAKIRV